MKKLFLIPVVLILVGAPFGFAPTAHATVPQSELAALKISMGTPVLLGTIDYTDTATNNHTTGTKFFNVAPSHLGSKVLLISCTTDCYFITGTDNSVAVTVNTGVPMAADEKQRILTLSTHGWISVMRVSTNGKMKVWELQ